MPSTPTFCPSVKCVCNLSKFPDSSARPPEPALCFTCASSSPFCEISEIRDFYDFPQNGLIGTGGFGRVVRARRRDGTECAVKVVGKQHGSRAEVVKGTVWREVTFLKRISHPNIVTLHAAYETSSAFYLDFELMREDAFMFMQFATKTPKNLCDSEASKIVRQLAEALAFLHSNGIAHLDVKLENVLINSPDSVKLADFGFAKQPADDWLSVITTGSGLYTPPEVLRAQLNSSRSELATECPPTATESPRSAVFKMDMWCLGVVTYLILCGRPPFRARVLTASDREDMLRKITKGIDFHDVRCEEMGSVTKDFLRRLLCEDPTHRLTSSEVLAHPFLNPQIEAQ